METSQTLLTEININELIQMNQCQTSYGTNKLREMVNYTLPDPNLLIRRQEILLEIAEKTSNKEQLINFLKLIKEKENALELWFSQENDELVSEFCFKYNFLNWSNVLTTYNKFRCYSAVVIILVYVLIYLILRYSGLKMGLKDFFISIYNGYVTFISSVFGLLVSSERICTVIAKGLAVMYIIYQSYSIFNMVDSCSRHKHKCDKLVAHYKELVELIRLIEELYDKDNFLKYEKKIIGDDLDELDDVFMIDFDKVKLGNMITMYKEKEKYKECFVRAIQYVGTLDAFITIADMIGNGYTVPIYVTDDKPLIHIENLYNPMLRLNNQNKQEKIIYNNFEIDDKHLMILTGPNKGGKSTYMKSVLLCILLAQTWGISPCSKIILTPFKKIMSLMSVQDSIGVHSLFDAEMDRCYNILNTINATDGFVFTAMDELFTGTNPKEGIAGSFAVADYLSKLQNSVTIISTHYHQICTQNMDNNQLVLYKKFEAVYDDISSKYIFPYKIQNGISSQTIALQLMAEKGYDDIIIKNALIKLRTIRD